MTVDEALESVARQPWRDVPIEAAVLAAEVRRLRAAVDAVKAERVRDPVCYALREKILALLEPKP